MKFRLARPFRIGLRKLALLGAAVLALGTWLRLAEPFSPRVEGFTVRQWLAHNTAEGVLPRREVVRRFGVEAVPFLLRGMQPSGLFSVSIQLENALSTRRFDHWRAADFDRRMACADWARMLSIVRPGVCEELLMATADDQRALAITQLFFGERYVTQTLRSLQRQETNRLLQARASQLLEAYWDNI